MGNIILFVFDYSTMLGDGRLSVEDIDLLKENAEKAAEAIDVDDDGVISGLF